MKRKTTQYNWKLEFWERRKPQPPNYPDDLPVSRRKRQEDWDDYLRRLKQWEADKPKF